MITFFTNTSNPDKVFRLKASCKRTLSPNPIFLFRNTAMLAIIVMIPRPPICIRIKMTICPNKLHADTVGTTTSPVTHVAVVAVNNASINGVACPLAELIGKVNYILPAKIAIKKLSKI